ncbi:Uncharacterised protein [Serratia entomophila]|nr:hypothetical protein 294p2_00009 [Serratia marcescens]CAI1932813.1 Uncharacterised protein [Serratia entomophila]CAI1971096.1 Uncharacterised protein [Serratia entomophila]
MRDQFERYIFNRAVHPLRLYAVVAIVAELSRRGLMFIGVPTFISIITNMLGILIIMLMQKPVTERYVYEARNHSGTYKWMNLAVLGLQTISMIILLLLPIYER